MQIAQRTEGTLAAVSEHVTRIMLIESEYLIAIMKAELAWVRSLIGDISSGILSQDLKTILKHARTACSQKPLRAPCSR